ncbi:MAG: hypothetical protein ACK4E8_10680 [Lacibacter sp.]
MDNHLVQKRAHQFFIVSALGLCALIAYAGWLLAAGKQTPAATEKRFLIFYETAITAHFTLSICWLLLANWLYVQQQRRGYLLLTWLFYGLGLVLIYLLLSDQYFQFRKQTGLWAGEFGAGGLFGLFWLLVGTVVIVLNAVVLALVTRRQPRKN